MVLPKRILVLASLFCALLPLASCANGPLADALTRSVAADPKLSDNPQLFGGSASPSPTTTSTPDVQASADFPNEIPRYPGAQLLTTDSSSEVATNSTTASNQPVVTRWSTTDSADQVRQFYLSIFQSNGWTVKQPASDSGTSQDIEAEKDGLQVTVSIAPSTPSAIPSPNPSLGNASPIASPSAGATEFTLSYVRT
ncbi:MAG TPA: hypothetical protein V6C78_15170, partial [Crinalium sp.]